MQTVKFKFHMGQQVRVGAYSGITACWRICAQICMDGGKFYRMRSLINSKETLMVGEIELLADNPVGNV